MLLAITDKEQKLEAKGLAEVGFLNDPKISGGKEARYPGNPLTLWSIEIK